MKCCQCSNLAIFEVGPQKMPMCLSCNALLKQTIERNVQMAREEMNFIQDSVDSMFGISRGARYPTKRPVVVSGGTINNNHIYINNSQIGVLNNGSIQSLNQTIDTLYSGSQKELAENIKNFSQTILQEKSLNDDNKKQVLESLDVVTRELFQKPENRKKSVVKTLIGQISGIVEFSANALAIWQVLHPMLQKFF